MYQNYNYYPQQNPMTQPQQPYYQQPIYRQTSPVSGLKGRQVASFEEARAAAIDFDGSVFYFPDLANKKIYTKQINLDGTAILNAYELVEKPVDSGNDFSKFVTRDELNQLLAELKAPAKSKVDPLSF